MNCQETTYYLEDYLDGLLDNSKREAIQKHVENCPECQNRLKREQDFRETLKSLPVATPSPNFKERAFKRVYASQARHRLYHYKIMRAAAGILVLISLGVIINGVWNFGQPETPKAHLSLNKQSEVKLVFSSKQDLENVTLTLEPPEGVEIPGFGNQRKIAWQTSIKQGKNVLELPVVARNKNGGQLTASIDYGDQSKEFNLLLKVRQNGNPNTDTSSLDKQEIWKDKLS